MHTESRSCHRDDSLGVDQTHAIALAHSSRLIRHSQGLGWQNIYVSEAVHGSYRATLPAKKHNCIAFCLHRGARIVRSIEGEDGPVDRRLAPRQFGIIPSGTPSHWDVRGSPDMVLIYLRDAMLQRVANEVFDADLDSLRIIPRLGAFDPLLEQLAMSVVEVLRGDEAHSGLYADSLAYAMAVQLLKKHTAPATDPQPPRAATACGKPAAMKRLADFIEHNLEGNLGLERLSAEAGLSPYYFVGAFSRAFGAPPHQYVLRKRVERAKHLLGGTDLPIAEIALQCGFSSQSHLTSAFGRLVGVPPRAYRTGH